LHGPLRWLEANQLAEKEEFEYQQRELEDTCRPVVSKVGQGEAGKRAGRLAPPAPQCSWQPAARLSALQAEPLRRPPAFPPQVYEQGGAGAPAGPGAMPDYGAGMGGGGGGGGMGRGGAGEGPTVEEVD
jgi:hypothetical protein